MRASRGSVNAAPTGFANRATRATRAAATVRIRRHRDVTGLSIARRPPPKEWGALRTATRSEWTNHRRCVLSGRPVERERDIQQGGAANDEIGRASWRERVEM